MIVTLDKALSILGERTFENHQMLRQARRQRRTEYTEIPCIPFTNEFTGEKAKKNFRCHILVANDFAYWERFQFKLVVRRLDTEDGDGDITPEDFTLKLYRINTDDVASSPVDLTPYLWEQHDQWIDGDSISGYYPTEQIGDDADLEDFYDILAATTVMKQEAIDATDEETKEKLESDINKVLTAGTKRIEISSKEEVEVQFIPYAKFSNVNR